MFDGCQLSQPVLSKTFLNNSTPLVRWRFKILRGWPNHTLTRTLPLDHFSKGQFSGRKVSFQLRRQQSAAGQQSNPPKHLQEQLPFHLFWVTRQHQVLSRNFSWELTSPAPILYLTRNIYVQFSRLPLFLSALQSPVPITINPNTTDRR